MRKTSAELDMISKNLLYSLLVVELMSEFPAIRKAIDRIPKDIWLEWLNTRERAISEHLITMFGNTTE